MWSQHYVMIKHQLHCGVSWIIVLTFFSRSSSSFFSGSGSFIRRGFCAYHKCTISFSCALVSTSGPSVEIKRSRWRWSHVIRWRRGYWNYWKKLTRVQNGVLENESISSSCQAWWVMPHNWVSKITVTSSFEHSVSLHCRYYIHIVTDLASSSWGGFEVFFLGGVPPNVPG